MKTKERQQKREEVQEGEGEKAQWREGKGEREKEKKPGLERKSFMKTRENLGRW